jgi:pilus assembly protein Flp/PilA
MEMGRRRSGGLTRDEGQGLVEYALIIALVALAVIAALTLLGGGITTTFNNIVASL